MRNFPSTETHTCYVIKRRALVQFKTSKKMIVVWNDFISRRAMFVNADRSKLLQACHTYSWFCRYIVVKENCSNPFLWHIMITNSVQIQMSMKITKQKESKHGPLKNRDRIRWHGGMSIHCWPVTPAVCYLS